MESRRALDPRCVLAFCGANIWFFPHENRFQVDAAALDGRVDRQLTLCCFFGLFQTLALMLASSGLRWSWVPKRASSLAPPRSAVSRPPSLAGLPAAQAELPLVYRTCKASWWVILLEVTAVFLLVLRGGAAPTEAWSLQQVNPEWLALLALPISHAASRRFARVTFIIEQGRLLTLNLPFFTRNRSIPTEAFRRKHSDGSIPTAEIRGIQVNPEVDASGVVTHYSLLLVRALGVPTRLVERLPSAECAHSLARQIDILIREGA